MNTNYDLQDRLDILNVLSLYSHYVDEFQLEDWYAACFSADITFTIYSPTALGAAPVVMQGYEGLREFFQPRFEAFQRNSIQRRHMFTNIGVSRQRADQADICAYVVVMSSQNGGAPNPVSTSRYVGTMSKFTQGWRIVSWNAHTDSAIPPVTDQET